MKILNGTICGQETIDKGCRKFRWFQMIQGWDRISIGSSSIVVVVIVVVVDLSSTSSSVVVV